MSYGVINEQGFPYEDSNEGFRKVTEDEQEKVKSIYAPEEPTDPPVSNQ
jgi:hypothetical protein